MNKRALLVSLEKTENDSIKVSLDDLIQKADSKWIQDVLYTFKEYDVSSFEELDFDEKELADFGYSIMARLYAFYKQGEI